MSHRPLIVLKFGGSVLGGERDLPQAVHEVYRWVRDGYGVVAVVSAFEGTTDRLLRSALAYGDSADPFATAALVATGERTGTLAGSLTQAAALLESDVARRLERLTAWLEPALVIAAGALVLVVVSAVLVPILSLDPTGGR